MLSGEEQATTTQGRDEFATYLSSSTGLNFAVNRKSDIALYRGALQSEIEKLRELVAAQRAALTSQAAAPGSGTSSGVS